MNDLVCTLDFAKMTGQKNLYISYFSIRSENINKVVNYVESLFVDSKVLCKKHDEMYFPIHNVVATSFDLRLLLAESDEAPFNFYMREIKSLYKFHVECEVELDRGWQITIPLT